MEEVTINYTLIILALLVTSIAQIIISISYRRFKNKQNNKNLTGFDIAREILDKNDLNDILILETDGNLTDHYDPTRKVLKLSKDIYHGTSIASSSVAAHECGHAIQDKDGYLPMRIRSKLVPITNFCTKIGYLAVIIGSICSLYLVKLGIILLLSMLVFQLITLPVEFNASKRALKQLESLNLLDNKEKKYARKMLSAAAFTYIASVLSTLLEILRYVLILNSRER